MSAFADLRAIGPQEIWNGVVARAVSGERITLGVVEIEAGSVVPEHAHENESRELGPGGTWRIPANTPHEVTAGPDGAVVIDVFAPARDDWSRFEPQAPRAPLWPET